jgi:hypothetical protein
MEDYYEQVQHEIFMEEGWDVSTHLIDSLLRTNLDAEPPIGFLPWGVSFW